MNNSTLDGAISDVDEWNVKRGVPSPSFPTHLAREMVRNIGFFVRETSRNDFAILFSSQRAFRIVAEASGIDSVDDTSPLLKYDFGNIIGNSMMACESQFELLPSFAAESLIDSVSSKQLQGS